MVQPDLTQTEPLIQIFQEIQLLRQDHVIEYMERMNSGWRAWLEHIKFLISLGMNHRFDYLIVIFSSIFFELVLFLRKCFNIPYISGKKKLINHIVATESVNKFDLLNWESNQLKDGKIYIFWMLYRNLST